MTESRAYHPPMDGKIVASVVFPIDVACEKCRCEKTLTASGSIGDQKMYFGVD
jgi:hypothetical protein